MKEKVAKKLKRDKPIFWRNLMYQSLYFVADSPTPEIFFVISLILSRWYLNSDFSYPIELIIPIIMFSLLGSVIYYIYRLVFGKGSAAHLAAILLLGSFYGYEFIMNTKIASTYVKVIPSHFRTDFAKSILMAATLALLAALIAWLIRWTVKHFTWLQRFQAYKIYCLLCYLFLQYRGCILYRDIFRLKRAKLCLSSS
jgi:hypothetical protein